MNISAELRGYLRGDNIDPFQRAYIESALDSGAPVQYAVNVPGPGRKLILSLHNLTYYGE